MLFVLYCKDRRDSAEIRQKTRPAHLEWLEGLGTRLKMAGPLLADDHATMVGSLLVIEARNQAEAEAVAALDPYGRAGLFETAEIRPFRWVVNNPEEA